MEVFVLREGRYRLLGEGSEGETAQSELLAGFEVAVREIFASG